jgi:hypothetical protein
LRDFEDDPAKRDQPERGPDSGQVAAPGFDRAFARLRSAASAKSRRDKHRVAAALFGDPPESNEPEPPEPEPAPSPTSGEG